MVKTVWKNTSDYFKPTDQIKEMISPFLGGDDPLFGKRTNLNLEDFFDTPGLQRITPDQSADINIISDPEQHLLDGKDYLYILIFQKMNYSSDHGQEVLQTLEQSAPADPKEMYKRFYFVDWIVLNKHKRSILKHS